MMKTKNPYIAGMAICLLIILIYSCRKEFSTADELNPKVEWAKNYFTQTLLPNEGNLVDVTLYYKDARHRNLSSINKRNMKIPIWQKAMSDSTKEYSFVEIPLKYTTKITPALYLRKPGETTPKTADESILRASLDRLIIFKNKKGRISQRIVTVIPTKEYLSRHNGDISHNKINKLDKDFDGMLIYKNWNGSYLFALIIKNGKAIKKLKLETKSTKIEKTAYKEESCDWYDMFEWFQVCYFNGDDPVPTHCDPPYSEYVDTIQICTWVEDEDPCLDPANFENGECTKEPPACKNCPNDNDPEDDGCPTAKTAAAAKVNTMVANNTSIANAVTSVLGSSNNGIEAVFRIDNNAGTITASTPVEEEEHLSSTSTNTSTIAIGHNHNLFPQPSPFDFYQAGNLAIQSNGKLSTLFTFSPSASYAIVITNTTLFSQFLTNYPMSSALAKDQNGDYTGDWKYNTGDIGDKLYVAFGEAYLADPRSNGTTAEQAAAEIAANEYAMARLMTYTMGGATLLKKDSNGNWKALHYSKYILNGVTYYTVTPCN